MRLEGRREERKRRNPETIPTVLITSPAEQPPSRPLFFFQPPEGAERRGAPDDRKYVYCIYSQVFSFNFRHHLRCLKLLKNGRKEGLGANL